MFLIKYAGIHNINQHYFESNMQAGIDYDFLLFFHTPYCFGANKNETTEYSPNTIVYIPKFTPYYYSPVKNTSNELFPYYNNTARGKNPPRAVCFMNAAKPL